MTVPLATDENSSDLEMPSQASDDLFSNCGN